MLDQRRASKELPSGLDAAWDGAIGLVRRDPADGLFKMWYSTGTGNSQDWLTRTLVCYATSIDGVHWHRPSLGIHSFRGVRENNIIAAPCIPKGTKWRFGPFSNTVNPHDPQRPHKALVFSSKSPTCDRMCG